MEIRLLTSSAFKLVSYHKERERAEDSRQKTQTQRLHFSLEDVKISVLKKNQRLNIKRRKMLEMSTLQCFRKKDIR